MKGVCLVSIGQVGIMWPVICDVLWVTVIYFALHHIVFGLVGVNNLECLGIVNVGQPRQLPSE